MMGRADRLGEAMSRCNIAQRIRTFLLRVRIIKIMVAKLSTWLVLATALLLVAPPGWCCITPTAQAADEVGFCPACAKSRASSEHAPRPSDQREGKHCCCSIAATAGTPEAKVAPPVLWAWAPLPLELPSVLEFSSDSAAAYFFDTGPSFRVLQCVWRL